MAPVPIEPKRKRAQLPSSAYDQRYKDVFLRGRRAPFVIEFDSANELIKFRQRAQQYRAAVNREGDKPLAKLLYEVVLRVDPISARRLIVEPSDAQFDSIFRNVSDGTSTPPPSAPMPQPPADSVAPEAPTPDGETTLEHLIHDIDMLGTEDFE